MLFTHLYTYGKFFSPDGEGGGGAGASGGSDGSDAGNDGSNGGDGEEGEESDETSGLKKALDAERKSRKQMERDLKAAKQRLDEIENAGKPEADRLATERDAAAKRAEAAEQRLRDANARVAVTEAATKVNAISVRAVLKLIEDDLEFDDEGTPTNVDALIAAAKKDEPSLFRAAAGSADGGKNGTTGTREVNPGLDRLTHAYETSSKSANRR